MQAASQATIKIVYLFVCNCVIKKIRDAVDLKTVMRVLHMTTTSVSFDSSDSLDLSVASASSRLQPSRPTKRVPFTLMRKFPVY